MSDDDVPPTDPPSFSFRQGFLSFQNLNIATLAIILAFSGMVTIQHLTFTLLSFFYILFLNKFSFPSLSTTPSPPIFSSHQLLLTLYVSVGAFIGLVLPVAYMVYAAVYGDKEGMKAAAPHVFLLACQVLMEGVTFCGGFSLPVRVFVPVAYNAMRMYAILDWFTSEVMIVGKLIAFVNLVFWGFNLFGFLLPVYMPKAFKKYYEDSSDHVKDKDS